MKYKTIDDVMRTDLGKALYSQLAESFDHALKLSPVVEAAVASQPCFLGSQKHLEAMVFNIMNEVIHYEYHVPKSQHPKPIR